MSEKVIITGASRGVGLAAAKKLTAEGCRVIACCRTHRKTLEALSVTIFQGDLSDPAEVSRLFDLVRETFGAPDVLINNAGIADIRLFQDSDDENYLKLLHTNLSSCVRCSKEAVKLMLPQHKGRILNISSVWGSVGASMEAEYSLTKGGIDALTKALAKELAPSGIAVNALSLGAVDTEMNAHLSEEEKEALKADIPIGRMASPEEAAEMISLILKAPLYLTGAVIRFDGAWC